MSNVIKIASFNVRGLRNFRKRRQVFSYLHRRHFQIILLQETHSIISDERCWQNEWGGKIVFCHGNSNSRGVCFLFNPSFSHDVKDCYSDNFGRLLMIDLYIDESVYTLINIYAPNVDDPCFSNLFGIILVVLGATISLLVGILTWFLILT